jgi:hypothetical protein
LDLDDKPGRVTLDVWRTDVANEFEEDLRRTKQVSRTRKWLADLPREDAITVPALLERIQELHDSNKPAKASRFDWAGDRVKTWEPLLPTLARYGVVKFDDARGVFVPGIPLMRTVIDEKLRELAAVRDPEVDLTTASVREILEDAIDASLPTVETLFAETFRTSEIIADLKVPRESSYEAGLEQVFLAWFANGTVVNELAVNGKKHAVDLAWPSKHALIELVCHNLAGSVSRRASVVGHAHRLVATYGKLFPTYSDRWLINFRTDSETKSRDGLVKKIGEHVGCNRMLVTVQLGPPMKLVSIQVWPLGSSKPIEST